MAVLPPLGTLYYPSWSNIAWSQPLGAGTTVYPQQNNGPFLAYPVPGQFFEEAGEALWRSGCGHGWDCIQVFRDYDSDTDMSVAILACPICTFIINYVEPYERVDDVIQYPILIG